jgi:hypothetical protein
MGDEGDYMHNGGIMKKSALKMITVFASLICLLILLPMSAFCRSDNFTDSNDYKDKNFRKGILADYNDLKNADGLDWAWIAPGEKLGDYKVTVATFEDATDDVGKSQLNGLKTIFKENIEKGKGSKGTLSADISIYEIQKFSPAKAWIPYAGGHQMQAGVGVEVLLKNQAGKTVGKIRHFAREGSTIEAAAEETATDIKKYINRN